MNNDTLKGYAEIVAIDQFPPTTKGNGFILCVFGTESSPKTHWLLDADKEQVARPMEKEVSWPPGKYTITFTAAGGATPPRPLKVVVRSGLGTIVIVSYTQGGAAAAA